jgi:uncharacterized FlgJ-related protein
MLVLDKKTLQYIEVENNYQKPFYICLTICLILIMSLCFAFKLIEQQNKELKQIQINKCEIEKINIQSMKKVDSIINEMPFSDKQIIKKQYRLESAHLASDLVKNNNNCFGMRASSRRHTYVGIDKNGYAIYSSIYMSIVDRLLYDIYVGTSLKNYASDPLYLKKLNIKK